MSDALILGIVQAVLTLAGIFVTGYVSIQLAKVHKQINSRMDQQLQDKQTIGRAEGKAQEKEDSKNRKDNAGR